MAIKFRRRVERQNPADLNITAFLNLMVILVPFLLITAVFSRLAILDLNIPPATESQPPPQEQKKEFQLVVTVRHDQLEVGDTLGGLIKTIGKVDGEYDYAELSELLKQIKARFPDKESVSILLEPNISYDTIVQIMDKVRVGQQVQGASLVKVELFPAIAIGDAPIQ